jgi:hypothetical protein
MVCRARLQVDAMMMSKGQVVSKGLQTRVLTTRALTQNNSLRLAISADTFRSAFSPDCHFDV